MNKIKQQKPVNNSAVGAENDYFCRKFEAEGIGFKIRYILDFFNSSIRVLNYKLYPQGLRAMMLFLHQKCIEHSLGKIIIYARDTDAAAFENNGFTYEGKIDGYYWDKEKMLFYSLFIDPTRQYSKSIASEDALLEEIKKENNCPQNITLDPPYHLRIATPADAAELARLYCSVFVTYPTPMEEDYIKEQMEENNIFSVICKKEKIVSAASLDINYHCLNAELTDCATLPEHRGKHLMPVLIEALTKKAAQMELKCVYTLARAGSVGINKAFYRSGYNYGGRLLNNCHIAGSFENMNIWSKTL